MKVVQVASSLYDWGGIERYVRYLDEGLTGRGHEVKVVCPPGSPLAEKSPQKIPFANRSQFSIRTYLAFRRICRQTHPDIAHIHFSPDFVMPALALRQATNAKIVMTRHLVLPWSPPKVKRYTGLFDHIIPVSEAVARKLAESGVPRDMMTVAKAGVPDLSSIPQPMRGGPLRVGSFGRLVKEKGVDVLLRATSQVSNIQADIYGNGPAEEELRALAQELGLGDRATFHGFVPDVAGAMNQVHCVCVPSTWDEAFPYSILEAMAMARAVVASRVGGLPEVVQDGVTGRLFDRGDAEGLAMVLRDLSNDLESLATMGERGREVQQAEYTIPKMAERIETVYRKVLG